MKSFLIFVTATTAIAGFLYGYDTDIISSALLAISQQFKLGHTMQETVASAIPAGAILGALTCGWAFERMGRRRMILVLGAMYTAGALLSSIAPNPGLLILARIFWALRWGARPRRFRCMWRRWRRRRDAGTL